MLFYDIIFWYVSYKEWWREDDSMKPSNLFMWCLNRAQMRTMRAKLVKGRTAMYAFFI